jgi:Helix-turn-helix domain
MSKQTGPYGSDATTIRALAGAIGSIVQTDGDHDTGIPALTLHRRSGPTDPLHCPLQYQKQLRLQEARQLMLNENLDASSAGGRVGYESPSQFSREYSRLFGAPPQRDVMRMRSRY